MQTGRGFIALLAATALSLGAGWALAASDAAQAPEGSKAVAPRAAKEAEVHRVRGEVTAVEPTAKTMAVKVMDGTKARTVEVDVIDKTGIRRGRVHRTLADIKVGDRVWMKYAEANEKRVADTIRILRPSHMAASK